MAALSALSIALMSSAVQAGDVHWKTNNFNGNWNVAANWNTNTVPGTPDNAFNDYANSTITFTASDTINSFVSAGAFNLNSGTLTGGQANAASTIQVNNAFTINGGSLSNFTVNQGVGGSIVFTSNGNNSISSAVVNGNVTFGTGAYAQVYNGGNAFNGTSTFAGGNAQLRDGSTVLSIGSGGNVLGYGLINQNGINATLTNNGTINANVSGQTLVVSPSTINGGGVFQASNGGTLSIGGFLNSNNIVVNAVNGIVQIDGGGLGGSVSSSTGTGISFSGNGNNYINNAVIKGNVTFAGGFAEVYNGNNSVSGTLSIAGGNAQLRDGSAVLSIGSGGNVLGYGLINQNGINATLTNNGTINANVSGQTLVVSPSTINGGGVFQASNGGTLSIGGLLTGSNATVHADTGTVLVNGGGIAGTFAAATGTGFSFFNNGNNYINGAVVNGNVTFGTGAYAQVYNGGNAFNGTSTFAGGNAQLYNGSTVLSIGSGGNVLGYGLINQNGINATLINNGTINANVSGKTLTLSPSTVTSNGTVEATNGGTLTVSPTLKNTGTVKVDSGSRINLNAGMTQTAGLTNVNGTLNLNGSNLALQGGLLSGSGTIIGNVQNTGGAVNPGNSPGLLTLNGNYTQTSGGIFDVELGGYVAGSQYDQFVITGAAVLGGTIDVDLVNGFVPNIGDQFSVLLRGSGSGSFFTLATDNPGLRYSLQYSSTSVVVTVLAVPQAVPEPSFVAFAGSGAGCLFVFLRRKRRNRASK